MPADEPRSPDRPVLDRRRFLSGAGAVAALALAGCSGSSEGSGGSGSATSTSAAASDRSARQVRALTTAFHAGVPLVVTMRTMQTFAGLIGVNRMFATTKLADASSKYVVAPNHDTVYVIAVLDLTAGPMEVLLPSIPDRYHVVQILDAWMGQVALLGTRATGGVGGSWVVVPPDHRGTLPKGSTRLDCPTTHAFVLGRVRAIDDPDDVAAAAAVGKQFQLHHLDPESSSRPSLPKPAGPPQEVGENGAEFFDELSSMLGDDAPVTNDQRLAFAAVSQLVGPGRTPTTDAPDEVPEMRTAVARGLKAMESAVPTGKLRNGWSVNLDLGQDASKLSLLDQAVVARYFFGPVPAEEAIYARAVEASDGEALDGSKRYRIRLRGDDLPPVEAFWSYTVYGEDLFFVANPIDRFSIGGDTPGLVRAADGSIDLVLQHDQPSGSAANWLPVPDGPFTLVMRCYLPKAALIEGRYDYPAVEVVAG